MLTYIDKQAIADDSGKIFQNYFVPFICLLKCADFSNNTSWAASNGALAQCNSIMRNLVKVPFVSFNNFLKKFGFKWDVESERFFVIGYERERGRRITLEGLDIFEESKKNDAVSALMTRISENPEILCREYLTNRACLILQTMSKSIAESSDIFGTATLDDILLDYIDKLPKREDIDF